jgi:hypothetical protein
MHNILAPAIRSSSDINRWLKANGCPEYADIYRSIGEKYGVSWDLAIFQSYLETGGWRFGNDVKPGQNNFAGIGARGGGDPGDSFISPAMGIEAQIQNLALRAGKQIPIYDIVSDYVKRNYDFIKARNTHTWESLSGTWATDTGYCDKILLIAAQFDGWLMENSEPTWFELYRSQSARSIIVAWAGSKPLFKFDVTAKRELIAFLEGFTHANSVLVAPATKSIPDVADYRTITSPEGEGAPSAPAGEEEPARVSRGAPGQKRPWISWAEDIAAIKTQGDYPRGFPEGAVVHFTAGRTLRGDHSALVAGPYPCLIIDRDGKVYQPFPLNKWGWHSGTNHHRTHVGIEICAAGMLKVDRSWFGSFVPADEIRVIKGNQGQIPIPGNYHKFTREQEESQVQLLLYLKNEAPDIFSFDRVIGHDEAMQSVGKYGNKNDPGGALSMTMPQLRAKLYTEYAKNES